MGVDAGTKAGEVAEKVVIIDGLGGALIALAILVVVAVIVFAVIKISKKKRK